MEAKAYSMSSEDINYYHKAIDAKNEAELLDQELKLFNNSLNKYERNNYLSWIIGRLKESIKYQNLLLITRIYKNFNQSTDDHYVTTEAKEGYDYIISYDSFQSYIGNWGCPVLELNTSGFYGDLWSYNLILDQDLDYRPKNPLLNNKEIFFGFNNSYGIVSVTEFFLFNHVIELQTSISDLLSEADLLEIQASTIGLGVTLTTIAVVLSTAMANRINAKKMEKDLALLKDEGERTPKRKLDLISVPVLIIAAIISLLGIAIPLIF